MPRHSMQGSAISIVRQNPMACSATPFSREWQQSRRIYLRRAPMAVTSKRERALQVVLVVWGVLTVVANIYPLMTSFLAGLRPTAATAAPMFWTMYATLGGFLVLAARNPSAYRSLIAFAVWSSFAHAAVLGLVAIPLPPQPGERPAAGGPPPPRPPGTGEGPRARLTRHWPSRSPTGRRRGTSWTCPGNTG